MKVVIFFLYFLVIISFAVGSAPNSDDLIAFGRFKIKYSKNYKNATEERRRLLRFIIIRRLVEKHNKKISDDSVDFKLGINRFADMDDDEITTFVQGNRQEPYDFSNFTIRPKEVVTYEPDSFPPGPTSIDWNARGKVAPVKDQGSYCSCCWAFGALASFESALAIKTGQLLIGSEQNLVDCNRNDQTGNWGCSGGSMATAFMYIQFQPGVASLNSYPYEEQVQHEGSYKCRYNKTTSIGTVTGYARLKPNEVLLRDVVAAVGPVSVGFNAKPITFLFYSSGIYNDDSCSPPGLDHAVLIYGYGTARYKNGSTIDYWMVKNSWSSDWGNAGYFRLVRNKNMCGIITYMIVPLV